MKDLSSRKIYKTSFGVELAIDDYEFMGISWATIPVANSNSIVERCVHVVRYIIQLEHETYFCFVLIILSFFFYFCGTSR